MADEDSNATPTQGMEAIIEGEDAHHPAIEMAFDYRGDVTVTTAAGEAIEGFLYDRQGETDPPIVRIMPKDGSANVTLPVAELAKITFTGRDTAAGKSWETWLRKYAQKKAAGEPANLMPDDGED